MFYQIKNIYSGPGNLIYARVDYWAAAEDKFLGLPPVLKNDFITDIHCPEELVRQIKMFGQRAKLSCFTGDYTTHFPNHRRPISTELTNLIDQQGIC